MCGCIRWLYRRYIYVYDTMNEKKSLSKGGASINPADLATFTQTLRHRINAFGHPSGR